MKKPLGIDANGYDFGAAMLAVGEQGAWVSYVYENPAKDNVLGDEARVGNQARRLDLWLRLVPSRSL